MRYDSVDRDALGAGIWTPYPQFPVFKCITRSTKDRYVCETRTGCFTSKAVHAANKNKQHLFILIRWDEFNKQVATLISKIYNQLMQLNSRNVSNPIKKMGQRTKQTFLQKRHTDG